MQRTISSELGTTAVSWLARTWSGSSSGSSSLLKFEEALAGGFQHVRAQHSSAATQDLDGLVNRAQPAITDVKTLRTQGQTAPSSRVRAIQSSASQPEKAVPPQVVIGTRDTCYSAAPACIDITAEKRAAAEAHMSWADYIKLHKANAC
ncbi:hypothetical protein WJX84_007616 [Apatococcus fuscideae]|uniref:Uncharacterized protein n=1 Tax=Apatococcus fuscideae TaxID=2026836 RepID=A0AAW1T7T9_9CHLO